MTALAQSGEGGEVLTLEQAADFAIKIYRAVRVSREQMAATQTGIGLAHMIYLPRTDTGLENQYARSGGWQ